MKILLTGGGTAGHFYPLIAIAEEISKIAREEKLARARLYFMSTDPYDEKLLFDNDITFKSALSGKSRLYFSPLNFIDKIKLVFGIARAVWSVYLLYPDVVVSKGGYASVPAVAAARILRIPVIVHESDSVPGRANLRAARFARKVAVSWPEAAEHFPKGKTAVTGQPVRREVLRPIPRGAREYLKLSQDLPVILILGGSQGAQKINQVILDLLPPLVFRYQVIHQTGRKNLEEVKKLADVTLGKNPFKERYQPFGYLGTMALRMAAGAATLVISRAGSVLFEIAAWGIPSIIIPITESNGDHQRKNAFTYARSGAGIVVAEANLSPHILISEIERIIDDVALRKKMRQKAQEFFIPGAAEKIARAAIDIGLEHER